MKSVKGKFKQLQSVFLLLAILVAIQLLLLYGLHLRNNYKLSAANDNVHEFLELLKLENKVFEDLSESVDSQSVQGLAILNEKILAIKSKIQLWGEKNITDGFLTDALVKDELRRIKTFQKVVVEIRAREFQSADKILQLEKNIFFSRPLIVSSILESVIKESQSAEFYIQSSFLFSLILNVPVFALLLLISKQLFKDVQTDISSLVDVAQSITDDSSESLGKLDCQLEETHGLFEAFTEMETALRNRKMLSKNEVARAHTSKKKMEVKVEQSHEEINKTYEQLSRKNDELEQILYAASHDLRTPLIGVQGFSQELQYLTEMLHEELQKSGLDINANERLKDILKQDIPNSVEFILKGSNKMDTMIQGLLRISRVGLEEFKFAEVNMDDLLKQIVDGLSFQAQSSNAMIIVEDLLPCIADEEKIEQVFTNLIVNAIKYRQPDKSCEIKVSSEKDGELVTYKIEDNGLGISEDNIQKIHNTFFRVNADEVNGEGLGLTIANRIIERHEGKLEVTSMIGQGSCFSVIIPLKETMPLGEKND